MATYVPGVPRYLPEYKPFTPDFKFIADVLQKRTDKYITNYKAINEKYGQVLYADMSREDTNAARNEFVNTLAPKLEKISGLDLSLAENVQAAKGIFQPFYDNKAIVFDMLYTQGYNNNKKRINIMKNSPNKNVSDMWWKEGEMGLDIRMRDFVNAPLDQAMQAQMPEYVQNPNLYERGKAFLDTQKYNVVIEQQKDGSFYNVVTKNGENITELAMNDLVAALGDDPLIQRGYAEQAFVESRLYADDLVEKGLASSIEEGLAKWSQQELNKTKIELSQKVNQEEAMINELAKQKQFFEDAIQNNEGPIPNSQDAILYQSIVKRHGALLQAYERDGNILSRITQALDSPNPASMINEAKSLLMNANLSEDFKRTAIQYSMKNKEVTFKVNEEEKMLRQQKFDLEKAYRNHRYRLAEISTRSRLDYEKELALLKKQGLVAYETGPIPMLGPEVQIKDGVPTTEFDPSEAFNMIGYNELNMANNMDQILKEMIFTSLQTAKNPVTYRVENNPFEEFIPDVTSQQVSDITKALYSKLDDEDFRAALTQYFYDKVPANKSLAIREKFEQQKQIQNEVNEIYKKNYANLVDIDPEIRLLSEQGAPTPFDPETGELYTQSEYSAILKQKGFNGELAERLFKKLLPDNFDVWDNNQQIVAGSAFDFFMLPGKTAFPVPSSYDFVQPSNNVISTKKLLINPNATLGKKGKNLGALSQEYLLDKDVLSYNKENIVEVYKKLAEIYGLETAPEIEEAVRTGQLVPIAEGKQNIYGTFGRTVKALKETFGLTSDDETFDPSYYTDGGGNKVPFSELYGRFLRDRNISERLQPKTNVNAAVPQVLVKGINFGANENKATKYFNGVYDNITNKINGTLTNQYLFPEGEERPGLFETYNTRLALMGDDPSVEVGDIMKTKRFVFGFSENYLLNDDVSKTLQSLKAQLLSPSIEISSVSKDGELEILENQAPFDDVMSAIGSRDKSESKKITAVYNNVDGEGTASYTIFDRRDSDDVKTYKVKFGVNEDLNDNKLAFDDVHNPVLIKIKNNNTNISIDYSKKENDPSPAKGLDLNISKGFASNEMGKVVESIIFRSTSYGITSEGDPRRIETLEKSFPIEDYKAYNEYYRMLLALGDKFARENYRDKKNKTTTVNTSYGQ